MYMIAHLIQLYISANRWHSVLICLMLRACLLTDVETETRRDTLTSLHNCWEGKQVGGGCMCGCRNQ